MRLTLPTRDQSAREELPGQLYIGFVDSLLVEVRSLFFACTASVTAALVAAIASRSVSLWACAGLMLGLSFVRMHFQLVHANNRPSPNIEDSPKAGMDICRRGNRAHRPSLDLDARRLCGDGRGFCAFSRYDRHRDVRAKHVYAQLRTRPRHERSTRRGVRPAERGISYRGRLVSVNDCYFFAAGLSVHQIVVEPPEGNLPGRDRGA